MDPVLCGSSAMADPVQSPSWIGCDANKDTVTALLCSALCSKSTVAKNRPWGWLRGEPERVWSGRGGAGAGVERARGSLERAGAGSGGGG